jgi:acyl-CoA synthetase (AMP-forming)/AMP-acid ligase II
LTTLPIREFLDSTTNIETVPAVAGGVALAAYLNAKFHIAKDLKTMYVVKRGERRVMQAAKEDKLSLWPYFEEQVFRLPENERAIWSREGSYTWRETYDQCNRYSQFMLSLGVQKNEMIGMYMTNSPEFLFTWIGSWGIGSAPAMVNYNLAGEALIHCARLADIKVLLVDWDPECVARIEESRPQLEALGIRLVILDEATKALINGSEPIRPGNQFRTGLPPTAPMALIYTRYFNPLVAQISY